MGALDISAAELLSLPPGPREMVKALLNIQGALFTTFGDVPPGNVQPFFFGFTTTLTALGTSTQNIRITQEADFVANAVVGTSDGDFTTLPRQDSSGRLLASIAVHNSALVGTAQRPGYLQKPWYLPANTTVTFDLTDLSNAENEVYFYLAGYKIFPNR